MNINLYTTAAFISAGMHRDVERLDDAREVLGTGCFEFVETAMEYTEYVDQLFQVGQRVTGDTPGVFLYEVAEEFGVWYVKETLEEKVLPNVTEACYELHKLALIFWSRGNSDLGEQLSDALSVLKDPQQPEL